MNKGILFILAIFVLAACSNKTDKPDDIISEDKMANILVDIHIAEAKVSQAKLPQDSSLSYYFYLENEIFDHYGVDSATYRKSVAYYTLNIRDLDRIYEVVIDSLNLKSVREEEVEKL